MEKLEDKNSEKYKAQESAFYGECQACNSRMESYANDMNADNLSEEEREYARQKYNEAYNDKREIIDKWKEEHGEYDEARANELIGGQQKGEEQEKGQGIEL